MPCSHALSCRVRSQGGQQARAHAPVFSCAVPPNPPRAAYQFSLPLSLYLSLSLSLSHLSLCMSEDLRRPGADHVEHLRHLAIQVPARRPRGRACARIFPLKGSLFDGRSRAFRSAVPAVPAAPERVRGGSSWRWRRWQRQSQSPSAASGWCVVSVSPSATSRGTDEPISKTNLTE